jgi:PAS domain S-box-containing protein
MGREEVRLSVRIFSSVQQMAKGLQDHTAGGIAQYAAQLAAACAMYFAAGIIGLAVPFTAGNVSPIWPASGVALASLLLFGWRCWPAIALAAFLVNMQSPLSAPASLGLSLGNTAAALAGCFLLRRIPGFQSSLSRLRDMLGLIVLAAILCSAISATWGCTALGLLGIKPWGSFGTSWLMYYLGDAMGVLLAAPLLLALGDFARRHSLRRMIELTVLLLLLAGTCVLLFDERLHLMATHSVLALVVFPFVLWTAIRFGVSATSLANGVIAVFAVLETAHGTGPFSKDLPFANALLLQLFVATVAVSGLLLAAVIAEQKNTESARMEMVREKAAQEASRESEKRYRLIVELASEGIWMLNAEYQTTLVNQQFAKMLGYEPDEMLGRTPEAFCLDDLPRLEQTSYWEEFRLRRKDGGGLWADLSMSRISDGQSDPPGILILITDISARKHSEEALRQTNRALRVLSRCNSAVVHATEEKALLDEVCRIAVGPAGYRLAWVGFTEQDEKRTVRLVAQAGIEKGFLENLYVSWGDNPYGRGAVGPAIRSGKPVVMHHPLDLPAYSVWRERFQTAHFESIVALPLWQDHQIFGALVIYAEEADAFDSAEVELLSELSDNLAHGIGALRARNERAAAIAALERSQLELEERVRLRTAELMEAKDAAESADHLKSAFLATMSHELRTPLNSIIGFTGIVLQRMAGPLTAEQSKQLGIVKVSAQHLLSLINDVLDISKIEAGQLEIQCGFFSMPQAIAKTVAAISPLAQKRGLALHTEISPEVDQIYSDQRRVEQILFNLIGNAVKFTDEGSVTIRCRLDGQQVITDIVDTGIGISPADQQSIFDPFRQADTGLARKREGTGLGLSICKRLVELLKGKIAMQSAPGEGSTFTLQLPLEWKNGHE